MNDVSGAGIGFDASDNEVWIVKADGEHHVPKTSKDDGSPTPSSTTS